MLDRAHGRVPNRNPFEFTDPTEVEAAFGQIRSLDPIEGAAAFGALAEERATRARAAEDRADRAAARTEWLAASNYQRVARYPPPNSPAKIRPYARQPAPYASAAPHFD